MERAIALHREQRRWPDGLAPHPFCWPPESCALRTASNPAPIPCSGSIRRRTSAPVKSKPAGRSCRARGRARELSDL